jgi:plasmid stabilization system protein ParE
MTFRVSQRAQARHDILELVAYIAPENPKAAAALVPRVLQGARDIGSILGAEQL